MTRLSIVLPALGGLDTVRAVLARWDAQARRDELELVALCPEGAAGDGDHRLRLVDSTGQLLHEARAQGIRAAAADHVFLAEDHCVPETGWSDAILERLGEGWDAIGCSLRPGEATGAWSQATFLLGYGEWMPPIESSPVRALPGHNLVLPRRRLVELGDELEELLLVSTFLVRRVARPERSLLEASARMRHFDVSTRRGELDVFATIGRSYGAMRTRGRSTVARGLFAAAFPAVAAAHWRRGAIQYRRAGRANGMRPASLGAAAVLAGVWALGEAAGALAGVDRVQATAWRSETKPVVDARLERQKAYDDR